MYANRQPDDQRAKGEKLGQDATEQQQFDKALVPMDRAGCADGFGSDPKEEVLMHRVLSRACAGLGVDPSFAQRILAGAPTTVPGNSADTVATFEEWSTRMSVCRFADAKLFQFARADHGQEWNFFTWQAAGIRLFGLSKTYEDQLATLLGEVSAHDSALLLKKFHTAPTLGLSAQHLNLLLGIVDEKVKGEISKHPEGDHGSFLERGGKQYEPTDPATLRAIFTHLNFKSGVSFYDLGSGYGHPILYGANLRPDISFTGIELMSVRVDSAQRAAERLGLANARFQVGDVSTCDFSAADVVFLFNPFVEEVAKHVSEKLADLADSKPLLIIDYFGAVTTACPGRFCQIAETPYKYGLYTSPKYRGDIIKRVFQSV